MRAGYFGPLAGRMSEQRALPQDLCIARGLAKCPARWPRRAAPAMPGADAAPRARRSPFVPAGASGVAIMRGIWISACCTQSVSLFPRRAPVSQMACGQYETGNLQQAPDIRNHGLMVRSFRRNARKHHGATSSRERHGRADGDRHVGPEDGAMAFPAIMPQLTVPADAISKETPGIAPIAGQVAPEMMLRSG